MSIKGLEDAERIYNRALTGREQAWAPEYTSTLDTVNNLGHSQQPWANQGRLEDSERIYNWQKEKGMTRPLTHDAKSAATHIYRPKISMKSRNTIKL